MSAQQLTVAQICAFAPALKDCQETSLTWNAAKPYIKKYVRATGNAWSEMPEFPDIDLLNREALGLDKTEALALLDLCYGVCQTIMSFEFISLEIAQNALKKWAQVTGAMECPEKLSRLMNDVRPSKEIRQLFNTVSGRPNDVYENVDIFTFNKRVRTFGANYHHLEMTAPGDMLVLFKEAKEACNLFTIAPGQQHIVQEFCILANKKL